MHTPRNRASRPVRTRSERLIDAGLGVRQRGRLRVYDFRAAAEGVAGQGVAGQGAEAREQGVVQDVQDAGGDGRPEAGASRCND